MDSETILEFIAELQEHPALWKKEDKDFINRDVRRKLLSDIGARMGMTEEECRKKLKNLKDKMREICYKLPKTASGQPAFHKGERFVRWPYFKALLFMKDQFINRIDANGLNDSHTIAAGDSPLDEEIDSLPVGFDLDLGEIADESTIGSSLPSKSKELKLKLKPSKNARGLPSTKLRKRGTFPHNTNTTKSKRDEEEFIFDIDSIERAERSLFGNELARIPAEKHTSKQKDEWAAFAESICHDLRKITNPYLIVSVKNDINKLIGETVLKQLNMNSQVAQPLSSGVPSHCVRVVNTTTSPRVDDLAGQQLPSTSSTATDMKTEQFG